MCVPVRELAMQLEVGVSYESVARSVPHYDRRRSEYGFESGASLP